MKILLDCRFKKGAGPNVATRYLLDSMVKLNTDHDFVILQHKNQPLPDYPGINKVMVPSRNPFLEFLWVQCCLPRLLKQYDIDVCHSLKHIGPLFTRVPTVLHVHEINHLTPQGKKGFQVDLAHKIYWNHILLWGLKRATRIIAITNQCKAVITQKLGIPKPKVNVIYYGIGKKFRVIQDQKTIDECRHRYNLPEKYILCVGNVCPQENYPAAVKMFAKLKDQHKEALKLAIVGDTSDAGRPFFDLIKQLGIEKDIIFTGYVEHDDLAYIYNGATLLLFPPLVATFSTPPIEAMACGIPVVASNLEGTSEVTDGAALLFNDPNDVDEMLHMVCKLLGDGQLRQTLQQKGLQRAKEFSWDTAATKVLSLYRTIGDTKNS